MVDDSAVLRTLNIDVDRTAKWLNDHPAPAGPRRTPLRAVRPIERPIEPAIIDALNRECPGWDDDMMAEDYQHHPDGNGGVRFNLGAGRYYAITGTTAALAEHYPDVPVTMTDHGHSVILMDADPESTMDLEVAIPKHLAGVAHGDRFRQAIVTANLAEGEGVITNGTVTIPAGTVLGTIHTEAQGRKSITEPARELQAVAAAALTAKVPAARAAVLNSLESSVPVPEHIREARRRDREAADVERDRAARAGNTAPAPVLTEDGRSLLAGESDMLAVITSGVKREFPTVFRVSGGRFMLYAGKTHSLHAPGGVGKSTLAQAACLAVLTEDPDAHVAYLDYEDTPNGVGVRLNALGMTEELMSRFHYFESPSAESLTALRNSGQAYSLIVIDGLEGALSVFQVPMNGYKGWHDSVAMSMATTTGAAVLMIDHPGHGVDRPIGSVFKINALTGAAYRMDAAGRIFLAGTDGKGKDRPRGLEPLTGPRDLLGQVTLETEGEGGDDMRVSVTMYPDMSAEDRDAAEHAPAAGLDAWMVETGTELSRGEVVAVAVALEGRKITRKGVPGLVRTLAPDTYRTARKNAWMTEAVNAAERDGYLVHPTPTSKGTWVPGTLSEDAAAAVAALSEDGPDDTAEDPEN